MMEKNTKLKNKILEKKLEILQKTIEVFYFPFFFPITTKSPPSEPKLLKIINI